MAGRNLFATEQPVAGRNLFAEEPIVAPQIGPELTEGRPTSFLPTGEGLTAEERATRAGEIVPESIAEVLPEFAGETAAGLATQAMGLRGAGPLVGLGAAGGEAFRQLGQQAEAMLNINLPLIEGEDAPATSKEAARRVLFAFARGTMGEVAARGILKGLGFAGKLLKPTLKAGAKEAIEAAQVAFPKTGEFFNPVKRALGVGPTRAPVLLPAEATESTIWEVMQDVAESGVFGKGRIESTKRLTNDIISENINKLPELLTSGARRVEIGQLFQDTIQQGSEIFRTVGSGLYRNLDNILKEQPSLVSSVDTSAMKEAAENMLARLGKGVKGSSKIRGLLTDITRKADLIPFEDAQILRSDLLAVGREANELIPGQAQGIAKRLGGVMSESMDEAAKGLSDEALDAWKNANMFWKEGKDIFSNKFITSVVNATPEDSLNIILKTGKVSNLQKVKNVIFDKRFAVEGINPNDVWKNLQGEAVRKIIKGAVTDEITGDLAGKNILKALRTQIDPDMAKVLFPKGETKLLSDWAKALDLNQRAARDKFLAFTVRAAQVGALGGFAFTDQKGSSIGIFLAPLALSRAVTSPTIVKLLVQGMKLPPTSKEAIKIVGRLTSQLTREKIPFEMGGNAQQTGEE